MADGQLSLVLRHLRRLVQPPVTGEVTDGQLLKRFVGQSDADAFQLLMGRHGPMVLGVCRRVLHHMHDAEDAFQATFLLLARKARSIRKQESVASWLHGVAFRTSLRLKTQQARRRQQESQVREVRQTGPDLEAAWRELQAVLDGEFQRLPDKYRLVLVLCYLEGKTHEEVAQQLGWPLGTVKSHLARGRDLLRERLTRRGLALSAGAFAALMVASNASAAVPDALVNLTLQAGLLTAGGRSVVAGLVSAQVTELVEGGMRAMFLARVQMIAVVVFTLGIIGGGAGLLAHRVLAEGARTQAKPPPEVSSPEPEPAAKDKSADRADLQGDGIPTGAVTRMGTVRLRHKESIDSVAFSPDGKFVVTGGGDQVFRLWDPVTGKELLQFSASDEWHNSLGLSPDGKLLATADPRMIRLRDTATGKEVRTIPCDFKEQRFIPFRFSPDGQTLAAGLPEGAVGLWEVATGKERLQLPAQGEPLRSLAFTEDGKGLVTARGKYAGGTVQSWDLATGKEIGKQTIAASKGIRLRPFGLSPDGKTLAMEHAGLVSENRVAYTAYRVQLWDVATGKSRQLDPQRDVIWDATFSPDSKQVAWIGMDNKVIVADAATGKQIRQFPGYPGGARPDGYITLAFSCDGKTLAAVGSSATVHLWSLATGREVHDGSQAHHESISGLAYSSDGRTLASASRDHTIRLWDAATGKQRHVFSDPDGALGSLVFSPDGKLLASASQQSVIHVWDAATGKQLRKIQAVARSEGMYFGICPLAFSADGTRLTSWGDDQRIRVWEVGTGKELLQRPVSLNDLPPPPDGRPREFKPEAPRINGVTISADARWAAVAASSATYLVDVASGQQAFKVVGHKGPTCLAFAADGRTLVTGGWDKVVHLWDTATGKELLKVSGLDHVNAVAFAPDGRSIAVATGWTKGKIHVFDVRTGKEILQHQGHGSYVGALAFAPDSKTLASGQRDTSVLVWDQGPGLRKLEMPARNLSPEELELLWAALDDKDAVKARAAVWTLVDDPANTMKLLTARLRPIDRAKPEHIQQLIADLDSSKFAVRESAVRELRQLGVEAQAALRQVLQGSPSMEVRRRIEAILAESAQLRLAAGEDVRRLQAIHVLEQVGSADATRLLVTLAQGAPGALQTLEARAAADRLARRIR